MADSAEDRKTKIKALHRTSSDDFVRFLRDKLPEDDPCPACGKDDWTVICPQDEDDMYRLGLVVRNVEKPFYLSVFAYYCDNCGYLRQHISKLVHDWVKQHPAEELADPVNDQEPSPDE